MRRESAGSETNSLKFDHAVAAVAVEHSYHGCLDGTVKVGVVAIH